MSDNREDEPGIRKDSEPESQDETDAAPASEEIPLETATTVFPDGFRRVFRFPDPGTLSRARALLLVADERYALVTVVIAAFGRAVSEVGAVMIVGGNIDGFTRVMTTAIALETSKGDLPLALALGFVLLAVVLVLNLAIAAVRGWRERVDGAVADPAVRRHMEVAS